MPHMPSMSSSNLSLISTSVSSAPGKVYVAVMEGNTRADLLEGSLASIPPEETSDCQAADAGAGRARHEERRFHDETVATFQFSSLDELLHDRDHSGSESGRAQGRPRSYDLGDPHDVGTRRCGLPSPFIDACVPRRDSRHFDEDLLDCTEEKIVMDSACRTAAETYSPSRIAFSAVPADAGAGIRKEPREDLAAQAHAETDGFLHVFNRNDSCEEYSIRESIVSGNEILDCEEIARVCQAADASEFERLGSAADWLDDSETGEEVLTWLSAETPAETPSKAVCLSIFDTDEDTSSKEAKRQRITRQIERRHQEQLQARRLRGRSPAGQGAVAQSAGGQSPAGSAVLAKESPAAVESWLPEGAFWPEPTGAIESARRPVATPRRSNFQRRAPVVVPRVLAAAQRTGSNTPQVRPRAGAASPRAGGALCTKSPKRGAVVPCVRTDVLPNATARQCAASPQLASLSMTGIGKSQTLHSKFARLRDEMKRRRSNAGNRAEETWRAAEAVISEVKGIASTRRSFSPDQTPVNPARPNAPTGSARVQMRAPARSPSPGRCPCCGQRTAAHSSSQPPVEVQTLSMAHHSTAHEGASSPPRPDGPIYERVGSAPRLSGDPSGCRTPQVPCASTQLPRQSVPESWVTCHGEDRRDFPVRAHSPFQKAPSAVVAVAVVGTTNGGAVGSTAASSTAVASTAGGYVAAPSAKSPKVQQPRRMRSLPQDGGKAPGHRDTEGELEGSRSGLSLSARNVADDPGIRQDAWQKRGELSGEESDPLHDAVLRFCSQRPGRSLVRLSRGVYLCGNKKLVMAIHNEKPMVRIGGGFVHLESYLADERNSGGPAVPFARRSCRST